MRWLSTFVTAFLISLAVIAVGLIFTIPVLGIIYFADDNIWLGVGGAFIYIAFAIAIIVTILEVHHG